MVAAQESYVVDSVCVGADRLYRMDGEYGSTYEWSIYNAIDSSLFSSPAYIDYQLNDDPTPGDTIWGSEIAQLWDVVGEFNIEVLHWSLHGCDTFEIGNVTVYPSPEADAGPDQVICDLSDILLSTDTVWNNSALSWTSTGDGSFNIDYQLHPVYALGASDSLTGTVTLVLAAYGLADNITCTPAVDSVTFFYSKPDINFSITELLCYNDSNAEITANITDGQAPYTFEWTGSSGFVSNNPDEITGLWAGTYTLTVTDANGCTDIDSVNISNPPELFVSVDSIQHVNCYGYATGFILSSATGGTGELTFSLSGDFGFTASGDSVYNLPGGTYLLTVSDENGCTDTASVVITEPDPLIAVIDEITDITCYGYNNGAAHVTVTDGTGPYTYSWNTTPASDSTWINNLGPGEYIVTVTDFNACMAWDTVVIYEPPPLLASVDSLDARCDGGKPGEIDLTISGGTPFANEPYYSFQWTDEAGNTFAATEDLTGLSGNQLYTVLVSDSLGCQITREVYINEIPMMELVASVDSARCYGDLWSIDLTVTEGRPAYSFEWKDSTGTILYTTEDLIDVPAGFYSVSVFDSDTCELYREFDLEEPALLLAEIVANDTVLCEGDAVILFGNPTGGTGTITHSWLGSGAVYLDATTVMTPYFENAPAGNYELIYTIVDEANCDASDTIELNVYPPTYSFDSLEVCMGEVPFAWNSNVVVSDRDSIYLDTLVNQWGCDSLLTLAVDVLFPVYDDTSLYVCANEAPFVVFSQTIIPGRDSIYLDTVRYVQSGCDSLLITVNVFTLPVTDTLLDSTLCAGAPEFVWNNLTILTERDSIYLDTLVNSFGCDSLLTYDITIIPPDTFYVDSTLCQDEPEFVWNGMMIQTVFDSTYEATLSTIFGCDSIVMLNMTIVPSTDTTIEEMLCYGDSMFWIHRTIYAEYDSIYLDTLVNAAGCDSLLTLDVTIMYPDTVNFDTTLCEGVPEFVWNSHTVFAFQDSIYRATFTNQFGCDSLVSLDVKILLPYDSLQTVEICENETPYVWYGHTILPDRDSIYFDTLYYDAGCDSLRLTLEIITLPVSNTTRDTILCEGSPGFEWNTHTVSTFVDSTYLTTLTNIWGCDSTLTLNVDVVPAFKDTSRMEICYNSPPVVWNGQTLSSDVDSTYLYSLSNLSGCDSLLFLEVSILPVTDVELDTTLCAGAPEFLWNNRTILSDQDRIYLDTLTNSYGCDSLLTYNVTVLSPDTFYVDTVICKGYPEFVWNSNTIQTTTEDSYQAVLTNVSGCDSVVILNVTLIEGLSIDTAVAACDSFVWLEGDGKTYTESGLYEYVVGNGTCADSFRLDLSISLPFDLTADISPVSCYGYNDGSINITMISGISPYTYLWSTGETTSNITNLAGGFYGVRIIDALGCGDSLSFEITEPDSIVLTETHVDLGDSYDPIGSINLTVSGGTEPYTFAWSNGNTNEDISGLSAGDYTVVVTDANNCSATLTVTLTTNVITAYRMDCLNVVELSCYEDLASYPMVTTLEDYLALDSSLEVYSDFGLDTASFTFVDSVVTNSPYCYTEVRIYSINDFDGNTLGPCTQYVIVNDTEKPLLSCPPTLKVTDGTVPAAYATLAEFGAAGGSYSDNCAIVSFTQVGTDVSDGGSEPEVITRVYEVSDYCGNVKTCTQKIEIYLLDEFVMDCPDLTTYSYECSTSNLPTYTTITQFRNAGGYVYSHPYDIDESTFTYTDVDNNKTCPKTITRTYSVQNENGETTTCTQVFTIDDVVDPTLSFRVRYITCSGYVPVYDDIYDVRNDGDIAEDNCRDVYLTLSLRDLIVSGTCPKETQRIYRLYDGCGNYTEAIQYIYENDTTAPVIVSTPDNLETDCFLPDPYADYAEFVSAGGKVTEECGSFTMVHVGDSIAGLTEPGMVYRTYRFSDACNNYSDYIQKIKVLDEELPSIGIPDLTLDCEPVNIATIDEFIGFGGWFNDNCEIDSSSFNLFYSETNDSVCPRVYVNRYEIYDMSGNRGWTEHTITVVDDEKPLLLCPPSDTIDINETFPSPFVMLDGFISGGGTASDNCEIDSASFTLVSADSIISACTSELTYTYIVADNCGNWSETCSYTIYKRDVSDPVLLCPADITVECFDDVNAQIFTSLDQFITAGGSATDNYDLDESSFTHLSDSYIGTTCPLIIIRSYQIQDVCGNAATCSYQITVSDVTPPVIVCPVDTGIECLSNVIHNITTIEEFEAAGGALSDNCEIDPNSFTSRTETIYSLGQTQVFNRFSISDFCGNIDSCTQVITLSDTIPPDPVCNDITVYLDDEGNYLFTEIDIANVSAGSSDNCTADADLMIDVDVTDLTCLDVEEGKIINVVVTDEAGNSAVCMANIVVVDEIPPVAICQNVEVYLDENGEATVSADMIDNGSYDNCKLDSIIVWPANFDCTDVGENTIQLYAVDASGNRDTCEAIVTIIDQIPPVIVCIAKQTIQLDEYGEYALIWDMVADSVWDECGIDTVLLDDYLLDCDDIGTTFITATAYDPSGNASSCQAEFEIFGNIAPNVVNDTAVTAMDIAVDISVVSNDYDLKTSINISTLGVVINPRHGSVVVDNATGMVTYTPDFNYVGTDDFQYSICDDGIPCVAMCGKAFVHITVRPTNIPPLAVDDYFEVPCGNLIGNVILNDSDPDGDDITVNPVPVEYPVSGVVTLYENGDFDYEPYIDFVGVDSFQYSICDNGIPSYCDTAWVFITRVADNDCDGVADVDDIDDDNDGIRDIYEGDVGFGVDKVDSDRDGIPDSYDIDSDNDGILDNIEGQDEDNYIPPTGIDSDGDGWDDAYDNDNGGYSFDLDLTDTDEDSTPDFLDIDADNDGVFDYIEGQDEDADGIADLIRIYSDTDYDGLDDAYDTHEGWATTGNETASNAPLQDFDSDGVRDWRDTNDEDDAYPTVNEDLNGDGDYSNDDLDLDGRPEYLDTEMDCELFIPEGFSPNDDGVHDFFQILCIYPRYPEAKMMIFNRNGQKIFEKENYGNYDVWGWNDAWWWGTSENTLTIGQSGGLPAGNYIYVLILNDGIGTVKNGTVMIAY
jgi:hypothetical protein